RLRGVRISIPEALDAMACAAQPGMMVDKEQLRAALRVALIKDRRDEEIFEFVKQNLVRSGYFDAIAGGIVLTGGAAIMDGMTEMAEHVLGLPTRRGLPTKIGGLVDVVRSPCYSTGVGLVMFGAEQGQRVQLQSARQSDERGSMFRRAWGQLAKMF
ncbi:MAG: hypothetical protein NT062_05325, partial [Proteobacteria bacterium]|nr:hypothetical protein [Pseudomonadota bacterium]